MCYLAGRDELVFHEEGVAGLERLPEGVLADLTAPRLAVGRVSCAPLLPAGYRSQVSSAGRLTGDKLALVTLIISQPTGQVRSHASP